MSPALTVGLTLAVALIAAGAVVAFTSNNALKKLAAIVIALVSAALAAATLGAPGELLTAIAGIAFAYCAVGVTIVVRLQEAYGSVETSELDALDEQDEPQEPKT